MGITVAEMMRLPILKTSKLLAGKSGVGKMVNGIALLESPESLNWLTQNCFVITNSHLLKNNPEWGQELIHSLCEQHCSGIALKIDWDFGAHLESMIKLADRLGIPMISLSLQCPAPQLINSIIYEIFRSESHDLSYDYTSDFLMTLLMEHKNTASTRNHAVSLGWSLKKSLGVAVLYPILPGGEELLREACLQAGFDWMLATPRHYILIRDLKPCEPPEIELEASAYALAQSLALRFPDYSFHIGVGRAHNRLLLTSKSYEEAQIALAMNIADEKEEPITRYSRMGIFCLLLEPSHQEELNRIIESSLSILEHYDEENDTEYYKTLFCYCENGQSVKHTAEAMHVHYNTIRYRLQMIQKLLGSLMTHAYFVNIQALTIIIKWRKVYETLRH